MRFSVTPSSAVAACFCMAAAYVGVLYTLPRTIRRLPRDHPTHVRLMADYDSLRCFKHGQLVCARY